MLIFHTTSPGSAVRILLSGIFVPCAMPADSGLNSFPDERDSQQELSGRGARLTLEWAGPIEASDALDKPGVLVDQMPHRLFLAAGTTDGLRVVDVVMTAEGWREAASAIYPTPWSMALLRAERWYVDQMVQVLQERVRRRLADHPALLVVAPRGNPPHDCLG